ncbi:MAG: hypothetical protein AB8I08_11950 [Sandaracinaceae bacterium]
MCWLLAPPPCARAQEALLVQASDPAAPWVAEVESAVLGELRVRGRDVVLLPREEEPTVPSLEPALAAFHDLRPEEALTQLEAWAEAARSSGELSAETRARGHVWRARVRMALSRPGVEDALDAALRVLPDLTLDEAIHPPPLREALALRRETMRWVTVELRVVPASTEVRLDGETVSPGPLRLVAGTHVLFASAPRSVPMTRLWSPEDGGTLDVHPRPRAGRLGEPVPDATDQAIRAAGRQPLLLEAHEAASGLRLRLRDGNRVRTSGPLFDPARLAAALFTLPAARPPLSPTGPPPEEAGPEPWWAVAVGAGALTLGALVVGLVVGLQSSEGFEAVGMRAP